VRFDGNNWSVAIAVVHHRVMLGGMKEVVHSSEGELFSAQPARLGPKAGVVDLVRCVARLEHKLDALNVPRLLADCGRCQPF
jgi:hypothetical protein